MDIDNLTLAIAISAHLYLIAFFFAVWKMYPWSIPPASGFMVAGVSLTGIIYFWLEVFL